MRMSSLLISLIFHPSPLAVSARSLRDQLHRRTPSTRSGRTFRAQKRGSSVLSARGRAVWLLGPRPSSSQVIWARRVFDKITSSGCWHAAHQRSGPKYLWLLEDHKREHWTQCFWILCFARFSIGDFALQRESKESMPRETVARQRRRGKRRFCDQRLQSRCQGKVDGTVLGVILFRLKENSFLMNEISENTSNEELKKLFLVKIHFRENCTRLSATWRSKIWSEEIQNTHCSSRNESLNLKDYSCCKIFTEQIKLSVREYICLASWRWRVVFTRNATQKSCREFEELKRRCDQKENTEKQRRLEDFHAAWSGITHSESIERSSTKITRTIGIYWRLKNLLRSWLTEQLWQCLRFSSSSHNFEFKKA